MTHLGKYLYCIIRCSEERTFEDVAPIKGGPVHTIPQDGLAAVVSEAPVGEYESSRANLLAHQRVQERVMREFTLLPVRFGTVAGSPSPEREIGDLLEQRFQEFDALLVDMEGKVELGLKALWREEKAIFEELLAQNEDLRKLRSSLEGRPLSVTHWDRVRLGEMVKEALDRKRAAEAASLLAPLRRIAHLTVENPIWLDRMIANAAFLVERSREGEFDQVVGGLEKEWGHRVLFKYVGPVPPYNFVNIIVNWQRE